MWLFRLNRFGIYVEYRPCECISAVAACKTLLASACLSICMQGRGGGGRSGKYPPILKCGLCYLRYFFVLNEMNTFKYSEIQV